MTEPPRLDPKMLGQRIVNRRVALRLEQSDLAERANLSRSYVSRLENGLIGNPKVFDLESIAGALETTLPELLQPDPVKLVETRYSHDWAGLQRQVESLPPEIREQVLRGYLESVAVLQQASGLARRN